MLQVQPSDLIQWHDVYCGPAYNLTMQLFLLCSHTSHRIHIHNRGHGDGHDLHNGSDHGHDGDDHGLHNGSARDHDDGGHDRDDGALHCRVHLLPNA